MARISLVVLIVTFALMPWTHSWFIGENKCEKNHGNLEQYPYYFGRADLLCLLLQDKKGKRSAPSVFTLKPDHSFLKYRGRYFEVMGNGEGNVLTSPPGDGKCWSSTDSSVTGYGVLSVECLEKCSAKYRSKYGSYNLFTNNCHHFVNRISEILCYENTCPDWCNQ